MSQPANHPHLLLLHGALGSLEVMAPLAKALDGERLVFNLNFSGHGGTPIEHPFGIDQFTADVVEVLDKVELEQVDIFGYSMGGFVGLNLALHHPKRVRRIFTLGTQFDWNPTSAAREITKLDPEKIEAKVPQFAANLAKRHHPEDWREVVLHTASMLEELGRVGGFSVEDFTQIPHPVVIAVGDQDRMVDAHTSAQVAKLLPEASFMTVPNCPHPIEKVDPDQLAALIAQFLTE